MRMLGRRSRSTIRVGGAEFVAVNIGVGQSVVGPKPFEELFEAVIQRPAADRACVIHPLQTTRLVNGFASLSKIIGPRAFAEHGRGVALLFSKLASVIQPGLIG